MAEVIEINDLESLESYRLQWDLLLSNTPQASFFHTLDWLASYWRHFGQGQRLRAMVVYAASKPIGIMPLCVRSRKHRVGSVRVLTYPLEDWGFYYGPIGGNPTATMLLALRHLATTPRDWDRIELPWTADTASHRGRAQRTMRLAGCVPRLDSYQSTSVIDIEESWDHYLETLDRKVRHELRRNLRRVAEYGALEFVRHRPDSAREGDGCPRWDLYDECESVSRSSWQAKSVDGNTLGHQPFRSYYRAAHAAAARLGMLDMSLLQLDGQPVAFLYGYHCRGRVTWLRMEYDACTPYPGLGKALVSLVIRDSFDRGDGSLDLGIGNQQYKQRLRTRQEHSCRLTYTPRTAWRSQIVRASQWLKEVAGGALVYQPNSTT